MSEGPATARGWDGQPRTLDEAALVAWGERIGRGVGTPVVVALRGELGAGKSTFARAIARGAGVTGHIPSPTFNLLFRYRAAGGREVWHLDLYRLQDPEEVWELGWDDVGEGRQIVLVEWPERAGDLLPPARWEITLGKAGPDLRRVEGIALGGAAALPE